RLPQDGRYPLNIKDKKYEFRVTTMPTLEAESIVLRILDNKNIDKNLLTLGLSESLLHKLKESLKINQGLILKNVSTCNVKST
ncbi:ATPase, T2SS/T4P/T4SS family, partial [Aliarcobacter butzleri]|uniref:ATPase, T2SS/T4P/T4SS family n=1 Tax=Aliarcobacter butzleri TaxID=28197 RepID=UPI003AF874A8